jgi:molybdopterin/thiamine biosynthesis adenylyltransferase
MSEETRQRFKDAVWLKYTEPVTLIGAGGIGSWVALLLYKMGYKIEVYDSDNLEELNIGSQLYSLNNCNNSKLKALQALLFFFNPKEIYNIMEKPVRFVESSSSYPVVICAVDNMETRELSSRMWFERASEAKWEGIWIFIDGRMDAETLEVFTLTNANDYLKYKSHLFPDSDIEHAPCSFKATPYTSALISSRIISCLINHITNCLDTSSKRSVPFHISEVIPLILSTTE